MKRLAQTLPHRSPANPQTTSYLFQITFSKILRSAAQRRGKKRHLFLRRAAGMQFGWYAPRRRRIQLQRPPVPPFFSAEYLGRVNFAGERRKTGVLMKLEAERDDGEFFNETICRRRTSLCYERSRPATNRSENSRR